MRRAHAIGGVLLAACFSEPPGSEPSGGTGTTGTSGSSESGVASSSSSVTSDSTSVATSSSETGAVNGSSGESGGCIEGELFCGCFGNGTCFEPLQCIEGVCAPPDCGDGDLDRGEECDDGNAAPADGCSPACQEEQRCFVALTGGPNSLQFLSLVVREGGSLDVAGEGVVPGVFDPSSPNELQTEVMTSLGRFVYVADAEGESIVSLEIQPDGVPAASSTSLSVPGVRGLMRLPGAPALLVWSLDDPAAGQYHFARHPVGPEGLVESEADGVDLPFSGGADRLRVALHPTQPVFYVAVDPTVDGDPVRLSVVSGFGPFSADAPLPMDVYRSVRRVAVDEAATSLLFTGVDMDMIKSTSNSICGLSVPIGEEGRPQFRTQRFLCNGWRVVGDLLEVRPEEFLLGSLANSTLSLATLDGEVDDAEMVAPGYHLLRRAYDNVFIVATSVRIAAFRFNDEGTFVQESSVDIPSEMMGFSDSIHAAAVVPCPDAR